MLNAKVTFFAPVYMTEDPNKVGAAVSNMANFGRPKSEEKHADFETETEFEEEFAENTLAYVFPTNSQQGQVIH